MAAAPPYNPVMESGAVMAARRAGSGGVTSSAASLGTGVAAATAAANAADDLASPAAAQQHRAWLVKQPEHSRDTPEGGEPGHGQIRADNEQAGRSGERGRVEQVGRAGDEQLGRSEDKQLGLKSSGVMEGQVGGRPLVAGEPGSTQGGNGQQSSQWQVLRGYVHGAGALSVVTEETDEASRGDEEKAGVVGWLLTAAAAVCGPSADEVEIERPGAKIGSPIVTAYDLESVSLTYDVTVKNPYNGLLQLADFDFKLKSGGIEILSGGIHAFGAVARRSIRSIPFTVTVSFPAAAALVEAAAPSGVLPLVLQSTLSVDTPRRGRMLLPLDCPGEVCVPQPLGVDVQWGQLDVRLGQLDGRDGSCTMNLLIDNPNCFDVTVWRLTYDVMVCDVPAASGVLKKPIGTIPHGKSERLSLPVVVGVEGAVERILRGQGVSYSLTSALEVTTPYEILLRVPLARRGLVVFESPPTASAMSLSLRPASPQSSRSSSVDGAGVSKNAQAAEASRLLKEAMARVDRYVEAVDEGGGTISSESIIGGVKIVSRKKVVAGSK